MSDAKTSDEMDWADEKASVIMAGLRVLTNSDEYYLGAAIAAALRDAHTKGVADALSNRPSQP